MDRKMQSIYLREGNIIELPITAVEVLNIKAGDELKLLFTEDAIIIMNSSKFGEKLLKKLKN